MILQAQAFGARGDGQIDDGPAVQKMLAAAAKMQAKAPVKLQFAPGHKYLLKTGRDRYAFSIDRAKNLTLDGGNSLFLIDSEQRFLKLTNSQNITVRGFKVDYVPLPFADGTIVARDKAAGTVDVKIDEGMALPPEGGATGQDGEQSYFGSLWQPGAYSNQGEGGAYWMRHNFDVRNVSHVSAPMGSRVVRVQSNPGSGIIDAIEAGKWRFSVPVRGIAHRFGPGESFQLSGNRDLRLENIELWSAPWFAFGLIDNRGLVSFRRVHVRPRPGTTRTGSAWRDAFHVKNNRASLLWEGCIVQGSGDDSFNISMHTSRLREVVSPTQIRISQNYPLGVASMEPGDALVFYSETRGKIVGRARIVRADPPHNRQERAPLFTIDLDARLSGVETASTLVWNETSGNPNTILRGCRMDTSIRFRSSVTVENCQVNALSWFTGDDIETPIPSDIEVRNCQLRLGQGNPSIVMLMNAPGAREPVIENVLFDRNRVWGDFILNDASNVVLTGNEFGAANRPLTFNNVQAVFLRGNTHAGKAVASVADLAGEASKNAALFTFAKAPFANATFAPASDGSLMAPFAHFYSVGERGERIRFHALPDAVKPSYQSSVTLGGASRAAFRVPIPALAWGAPTFLEALAQASDKTLEFSTFVPADARGEFYNSVAQGTIEQGITSKPLRWKPLRAGRWQQHRVTLRPTLLGGGLRAVRIGLGVKAQAGSASATPVFLSEVRLRP